MKEMDDSVDDLQRRLGWLIEKGVSCSVAALHGCGLADASEAVCRGATAAVAAGSLLRWLASRRAPSHSQPHRIPGACS